MFVTPQQQVELRIVQAGVHINLSVQPPQILTPVDRVRSVCHHKRSQCVCVCACVRVSANENVSV